MRARLIPVVCLVVTAAAPAAAQAKVPESVSCGGGSATVLFWPAGHKSVPSVQFPSIATPHLEVYRPGAAYPAANFLLYADAARSIDPSRTCAIGRVGKTRGVRHAKTIRVKKAVTCTAPADLSYDVARGKQGVVVIGHAGPDAYFRATIRLKGSSLTYDRTACRAASSPH